MSLQVWLPLNGNLNNQGLSNIQITNNGATINTSGKIGQCYEFNGSSYMNVSMNFSNFLTTKCSMCAWVKPPTASSGNKQILNIGTSSGWGNIRFGILYRTSSASFITSISDGTNYVAYNCGGAILENSWNHVAAVYQNRVLKIYINGKLLGSYNTTYDISYTGITNLGIGAAPNGNEKFTGFINDVRIYNHALSVKEVEEISKGLILHYKLNQNIGTGVNLIKNGSGELNNQYWNVNGDVSDIPNNQTEIKASFPSGLNTTSIPLIRNTTYRLSCWIKATATSGTTYPSFEPYDIDGNFISNYQSRVGFNLGTLTTISQTLNPGDTKIYVTSLVNWNANSGTHYNYAAIFGYKDSTGYIYPTGVYTRNTPAFGSGTNAKTNLDKTNNIITLNSAYNGPVIPIGTEICAATAGSTYFYPLGGISCASIQDWTYKETTFSSEDTRLLAATTIKFRVYTNSKMTGIKIINQNLLMDKVYDSSGYNNNGIISGTISGSSNNSARYDACTYIDSGNTSYITTPTLNLPGDAITINFWFKSSNISPGSSYHMPFEGAASSNQSYEMSIYKTGYLRGGLVVSGTRRVDNCTSTKLLDGNWHMCTMTYDGTIIKRYVDGTMEKSTSTTGTLITSSYFVLGHYGTNTSYYCKEAYISDVRLYTTALSDIQILELYNTSSTIDNNGNVYAREVVE